MALDSLWAGWRMQFLEETSQGKTETGECVLCVIANHTDDQEVMVIHRAKHAYVVLNIYPYTSAHLMVVPLVHTAKLSELPEAAKVEIFELVELSMECVQREYSPQGFNVGMNLGRAAGAGIAEHLHAHVVPRWLGDSNFMSTTANARVLPEALARTRERLMASWQSR